MSSHDLYKIHPVREGFLVNSTPEEDAIVSDHFHYLKDLSEPGVVLLAGRTLNADASSFCIVILTTESEQAAHSIMANDPAVRADVFRAELFPFGIALVGEGLD